MQLIKHRYSFILVFLLIFFLHAPIISMAQTNQENFSVTPSYPTQQDKDVSGYYDLTVKKEEAIELRFSLRNPSDKEIIITNTISPATTNKNGQIIYGPIQTKTESSAKYNLAKLIEGPKETIVPANATTDLVIHLKAPNADFKGIILGGIEFEQKNEKSDTQTIQNIVAYDIPILLRQSKQEVPLSFTFDKLDQSKLEDKQLLTQKIHNPIPTIAKKGTITTEIRKENLDEVLYEETNEDVNFAPDSVMDFAISLTDHPLPVGCYTAKTIVQFGDRKWETTDLFRIDHSFERTNATSTIINTKSNHYIYPLIIAILIIVIVALLYKSRTNKK
ncbi:hypothetical protein ABID30_001859 [Enterococcus rotai]|uniref:Uncharacterized protein n=1 Tax=Enterococcus rotai TaxID=118060 RepID=A0A0U2WY22_9ENTE|nr:DUF916 domain-containing protein [Enterococcus rotai]ALS36938.1 hypothetical protein ATZ35_07125 [Enterococcus rotai]